MATGRTYDAPPYPLPIFYRVDTFGVSFLNAFGVEAW